MKRTSDKDPETSAGNFLKDVGEKCNKMDFNSFFIYGAIVLAVGVGFYSLLSPTARNQRLNNPNDPKIMVAADGPSLRANVAPTLSSARYFLLINPVSVKIVEAAKNPFLAAQVVHGADVSYFVAGKGEEAVIAGDIGPQCYQVLSQYGIRAYGGYSGKVKDVVALYQEGRNSQGPVAIPAPVFGPGMHDGVSMASPVGFTTPFFLCPRCKWRVHVGPTQAQKIRCPNCGFMGTPADGFVQVAFNPLDQDPALDPTMPQAPLTAVALQTPVPQVRMQQAPAQCMPYYGQQAGGVGAYLGGPYASPAYPYRRYAQGLGNNQQYLTGQALAQPSVGYVQPVAWANNYGAGTGTGRRRTSNSPYVWR